MDRRRPARCALKKKYKRPALYLLVCFYSIFAASSFLPAQDKPALPSLRETEGSEFLILLLDSLSREGWSTEELAGLKEKAAIYDWQQVDSANPELVIQALRFLKSQQGAASLETGTARAQLIWQITNMQLKMRRLDFRNPLIVRTTITGLRIFLDKNKRTMAELQENARELNKKLTQSFTQALDEAGKTHMQYRLRKRIQANKRKLNSGAGEPYRHKYGGGDNNK